MDTPKLILVAIGLAMDALAVAVGIGLCTKEHPLRAAVRVGLYFGIFQAGMTVCGWLVGSGVAGWVNDASSWIAAALLWLIGGHMLYEALCKQPPGSDDCDVDLASPDGGKASAPACPARDMSRGWALFGLSIATSIDAFGVGMGLALLGSASPWIPALVIGAVAAIIPGAGLIIARHLAARTGGRLARGAEIAGALVLIGIGIRIAFFAA